MQNSTGVWPINLLPLLYLLNSSCLNPKGCFEQKLEIVFTISCLWFRLTGLLPALLIALRDGIALAQLGLLGWPKPDLVLLNTVPYKLRSRICTLQQKKISIVNKVGNWHGPHGRIFGRASFINLINETFLWLKNEELSVGCIATAIWLEPSDVMLMSFCPL